MSKDHRVIKCVFVQHDLPEPFPQVYVWKKKKKQLDVLRVPCTQGRVRVIATKYTKMGA